MSNRIITWHGHANFQIDYSSGQDSANILIDPFFTGNPKATKKWDEIKKPDIVLVTHMHGDHVGDAVAICKSTGALLATCVGTADVFTGGGVPESQILNGHGFNIGGSVKAKGVTITMTQAFHTTDGAAPVGYIIKFSNDSIVYHAGDTGIFGSMATLGELYSIDLALLPTGSVYTMDMKQAAYAAKLLKTKAVIPMHWGTFPALEQSMEKFPEILAQQTGCRCILMQPGEEAVISKEK